MDLGWLCGFQVLWKSNRLIKVVIGSDHRGYTLKNSILATFPEFIDIGCFSEAACDYPDIANEMANKLSDFGVLICNTGIGMSIAANRFPKVRAALCLNREMAFLSRQHNNSNILVIGAKYINFEEIIVMIKIFINSEFDDRHYCRVKKMDFSHLK